MPFPPPPEPIATLAQTQTEVAIVREINRARGRYGLRRVRSSSRLGRLARSHSKAMLKADALTHAPTLSARMAGAARRYGETLAWAPQGTGSDGRTIVRLWLNSPGHRAVLLDARLRRVGVGRVWGAMSGQQGFAVTADFSS